MVPRRPLSIEQSVQEAAALLSVGRVAVRPSQLFDAQCVVPMTFLEQPIIMRSKGGDRWVTSGGRKGATAVWLTGELGILKRYGRVVRNGKPDLKFEQFSVLSPPIRDGGEAVDDKTKALWVVQQPAAEIAKPTRATLAGTTADKLEQSSAPRVVDSGLAAAAPAPAVPSPSRPRGRYSTATEHEASTAFSLLLGGAVNPRPEVLSTESAARSEVFLEHPVLQRKSGFDRWVTSGGRKGATETWLSDTDGVLKRYARVVHTNPALGPGLKCAQYNLLSRSGPGAEAVEDKTKQLWIVPRASAGSEPAAPHA